MAEELVFFFPVDGVKVYFYSLKRTQALYMIKEFEELCSAESLEE
jgi:hypothetical protein